MILAPKVDVDDLKYSSGMEPDIVSLSFIVFHCLAKAQQLTIFFCEMISGTIIKFGSDVSNNLILH